MTRFPRILSLLLAMLFIIAGTAVTAAAVDDPASYDEPVNYDDPVTGDDPYTDDPVYYADDPEYPEYPGDYDPQYDGSGDAGSVKDLNVIADVKAPDKADIAPNEWSNITITENNVKKSDDSNFSFQEIQTDTGNLNDDSEWIKWLGYGLIGLSVLCLLYFIVATVNAKKEAKREQRHQSGTRGGGTGGSGGSDRARATERRASHSAEGRRSGHYADGYEATTRRGSKADTGEVYVPRRAVK